MKPFLQRLAEEIASRYGDDPGKVCVVLPNRRAGLYLKKYLAETLHKTSWSPQTFSIEDFITNLSGLQIIDPAGLLFEFYAVHREIHGEKAQDFEIFADWGQVLLQDFDEIDQYLIDPVKIFNYLDAARAMSVWNVDGTPLTDQEKNYLGFYNSFLTYYNHLQNKLTGKKLAYQGLAYRVAAEHIDTAALDPRWEKIFFAGLNALSAAEEKIIRYLADQNKAEVFWDADEYYIKDPTQEAGVFIRRYLEQWPTEKVRWIENDFSLTDKSISVFGIPGSMGQAHKAGQLIAMLKTGKETTPDKTALVLADEKLLLPVLYSLPGNIGPVNVTMGYPFKFTHLYQLVGQLFQLHENAEKFAEQRNDQGKPFYVKDVLRIMAHPYLQMFLPDENAGQLSFQQISGNIRKRNRVFMKPSEILGFSEVIDNEYKELNACIFNTWTNPGSAIQNIIKTLELLRDRMINTSRPNPTDSDIDIEYLYHLSRMMKRIRTMVDTYPFITTLSTLRKILMQLLDSSRLPFTGEPLQGLQVMGVLETRAIDFENIVVLSVNEGILPSGRLPNSFIPFDIKSEFGLPTYRHKDAVFAFHFYHMLQRAKNIFLLYDTEGDQMKGGEKSRFITQIGYELTKFNPNTLYSEKLLRPQSPAAGQSKAIIMEKTPAVIKRLMDKASRGFSPTSLNLYIKCPLKFYFQEILGLSEAESVEETIEAKTMGTVIHQVFQNVYEPFEGRFISATELMTRLGETENFMQQAFREHYHDGDLEHGKNHLIKKVSLFLVNQFIRREALQLENESLKIIALERAFERHIDISANGTKLPVKIKGKTDRIDQWGSVIRIIDYKTGSVQAKELAVKEWGQLTGDPNMGKAFQLLVYAWLFYHSNPGLNKNIQTGNITLKKISSGFIRVKLPEDKGIDDDTMMIFEEELKKILEEILNPLKPFVQTTDLKNCEYCPFTAICTRM